MGIIHSNSNFLMTLILISIIILIIGIIVFFLLISLGYIDSAIIKKNKQIKFQKTTLKRIEILKQNHPNCEELGDLYEVVRYSNPMSTDEVIVLEDNILNNLNLLEDFLNKNDQENSIKIINNIEKNFQERDIILKH